MADLNLEAERALFEAEMRKKCGEEHFAMRDTPFDGRCYDSTMMSGAWMGWQAARSAVPAQAGAAEARTPSIGSNEFEALMFAYRDAAHVSGQYRAVVAHVNAWCLKALMAQAVRIRTALQQPAQGEHSAGVGDVACRGCDPAEGFCRSCRESEQNARPLSYAAILRIADEVAINSVTDERRPDKATIIAFARAIEAAAATAQGDGDHSGRDAVLDEVASIVTQFDKRATPQAIEDAAQRVAAAHKAQQERGPA